MSAAYWENRYLEGGNSGDGSQGANAQFKADYLNAFVKEHQVRSVLEYGCGDGRQLSLADYPFYTGVDVSPTAIQLCRDRFALDKTKTFELLTDDQAYPAWDLVLSLDVIYHLTEDRVYLRHLTRVFGSAMRFVVLYTSDCDHDPFPSTAPHVRHRHVTADVRELFPEWKLAEMVKNPNPALEGVDFFVYAPC